MRCAVSPRGTELQDTTAEDKTLGYRWRREEQENVKVFAGWGWGRGSSDIKGESQGRPRSREQVGWSTVMG